MSPLGNFVRERSSLWIALGLYLTLALSGIHYGLPRINHPLSFNPDELTWLEALTRIQPSQGKINPAPDLITPTFYLEIYGASVFTAGLTGWIPLHQTKEWYRTHPDIFGRFYLTGRYLQVLCAILLLCGVWELGRAMGGVRIAAMASLLLAVSPSLVGASHFSQANIPVTLLAFAALACLWQDERRKASQPLWFYVGCFLSGLAIGTKYSALPLVIVVAYQMRYRFTKPLACAGALGGVLFGFFCGTPFAFLAPRIFLTTFHEMTADNLRPITTSIWKKITFPLVWPLRHAAGPAFLAAGMLGFLWEARHSKGRSLFVLWIIAFYLGMIKAGTIASPGRVLIMLPALALLAAQFLALLQHRRHVWIANGLFALVFMLTLPYSLAIVTLHREDPIQLEESQWIQEHIPAGATIGIPRPSGVYYWTPPCIYESATHPERVKIPYRVLILKFSIPLTEREKPEYILVGSPERMRLALEIPEGLGFLKWLDDGHAYIRIHQFSPNVHFGPWRWNRPLLPLYQDDDLWSPSLEIYQRKDFIAPFTNADKFVR